MKKAQVILTFEDLAEQLGITQAEIIHVIPDPLMGTVSLVLAGEGSLFCQHEPGNEPHVQHISRFQGEDHRGRTIDSR